MPEITFNVSITRLAKIIKSLQKSEKETLALLLTDEGAEILERRREIQTAKVKCIGRDEAFHV